MKQNIIRSFIEFSKGKLTKTKKNWFDLQVESLEIIHTDICGPLLNPLLYGLKYFISFINGVPCYAYSFLINDKVSALDVLRNYKIEMKNQLEKKLRL